MKPQADRRDIKIRAGINEVQNIRNKKIIINQV